MNKLTNKIVLDKAHKFGFDLVGFAAFGDLNKEVGKFTEWLGSGFHSGMKYMERNLEKRKDISLILPGAQSVISLGINYFKDQEYENNPGTGKVSRYAWGRDYHFVIWDKLSEMISELKEIDPGFEAVSYVDTGPVMDKVWAVKAGLGWQGKHTNVISKEIGSWFFIANIICNNGFDYAIPSQDFCGSCTACIDACPTDAIIDEYILDANKCISYLTIENKNDIPESFKGKFENWIFGCDICQEVCPWNHKYGRPAEEPEFKSSDNKEIYFDEIMEMSNSEFKRKFDKSPIARARLKGLKRNVEFII